MDNHMDCSLQIDNEFLPQVKEFKYLRVLFTSEGKMEREIDCSICSNADVLDRCGEEEAEPNGKALNLLINQLSPMVTSFGYDWKY